MKKGAWKVWLKRTVLFLVLLPFVFIAGYILYELVGIAVNHHATDCQTKELVSVIKAAVAGADVMDTYSETGNTSGTGNHVDMLSVVVFRTKEKGKELEKNIGEGVKTFSEVDEWGFYVESIEAIESNKKTKEWVPGYYDKLSLPEDKTDCYLVYLCNAAPFEDNIEGH